MFKEMYNNIMKYLRKGSVRGHNENHVTLMKIILKCEGSKMHHFFKQTSRFGGLKEWVFFSPNVTMCFFPTAKVVVTCSTAVVSSPARYLSTWTTPQGKPSTTGLTPSRPRSPASRCWRGTLRRPYAPTPSTTPSGGATRPCRRGSTGTSRPPMSGSTRSDQNWLSPLTCSTRY